MAVDAHARRNLVHSSETEASLRMIELPVRPLHCVMAGFATGGKTLVRQRAGRVVEILLMAGNASRTRQVEIVVDVAVHARPGWNRVSPRQRESH